ncbi:MAG: hypothetical protein KIT34_11125 [Cyanobacteria bacterium TGS_CYA1]|nr:hypothetical protein [Cyanobacteria bacterium TGS_CYA1]
MNFNAFEFYWLLAEQQKMRGNSKLAESFFKKAMEAAQLNECALSDAAAIACKTANQVDLHLHSENFSAGK